MFDKKMLTNVLFHIFVGSLGDSSCLSSLLLIFCPPFFEREESVIGEERDDAPFSHLQSTNF
jgi:hypothetical protein